LISSFQAGLRMEAGRDRGGGAAKLLLDEEPGKAGGPGQSVRKEECGRTTDFQLSRRVSGSLSRFMDGRKEEVRAEKNRCPARRRHAVLSVKKDVAGRLYEKLTRLVKFIKLTGLRQPRLIGGHRRLRRGRDYTTSHHYNESNSHCGKD